MSPLRGHRDLDVWKVSIDFSIEIYGATAQFPNNELYGLTSQLRRAAVSVSSNIAEGAARQTHKEFKQLLYCSLGSAYELETQLVIAGKLGYIDDKVLSSLLEKRERIAKMLFGLIKRLKDG